MKILLPFIFLHILIFFYSCGEDKTELPEKVEKRINIEPVELDACELIQKAEIEKIFNLKMKEPKRGRSQKGNSTTAASSECSFESDGEGSKIILSVYFRFTPVKDDNHSALQSARTSFKQSDFEITDVNGIGDVAFWGGNQLHVFIGDNYYLIITLIGIKEQDEAIAKAKEVVLHTMKNIDSI